MNKRTVKTTVQTLDLLCLPTQCHQHRLLQMFVEQAEAGVSDLGVEVGLHVRQREHKRTIAIIT